MAISIHRYVRSHHDEYMESTRVLAKEISSLINNNLDGFSIVHRKEIQDAVEKFDEIQRRTSAREKFPNGWGLENGPNSLSMGYNINAKTLIELYSKEKNLQLKIDSDFIAKYTELKNYVSVIKGGFESLSRPVTWHEKRMRLDSFVNVTRVYFIGLFVPFVMILLSLCANIYVALLS